jgi:hypothetical protein
MTPTVSLNHSGFLDLQNSKSSIFSAQGLHFRNSSKVKETKFVSSSYEGCSKSKVP